MSEWLISRDMNMTRANVVGNLLHPENWGKKKNPAATPSALADWGFLSCSGAGNYPDTDLGRVVMSSAWHWPEVILHALTKRGSCE